LTKLRVTFITEATCKHRELLGKIVSHEDMV
jgi:hypothetical protein